MGDGRGEEFRAVVIVVVDLLENGAAGGLNSQIELGAGGGGLVEPDVSEAGSAFAKVADRGIAIIDHHQLGVGEALGIEALEGLGEKRAPVARGQDAGDERFHGDTLA